MTLFISCVTQNDLWAWDSVEIIKTCHYNYDLFYVLLIAHQKLAIIPFQNQLVQQPCKGLPISIKKYNIHYNLIQAELCRDWYMEDITWLLRETSPWVLNNISQVSKEKKRNMFQHQMRNIVSPSCRVIFFLLNKHQGNTKSIHFNISF